MNEDLSQLNLVELLQRLEPIPEPAAVSLWPQTAAWGWIGFLLLLLAAWWLRRRLQQRRANAYRRAALAEIAASDRDPVKIAAILRRTALAAFPRAQVAGLHGEDWLQFLDRSYGGEDFCNGPGRVLASIPYSKKLDALDLEPLAVEWIKRHRADGTTGS